MSRARSDDPPHHLVDLERGEAEEEEEPATNNKVDPRVAMCVRVSMNVFTVVYVLSVIGLIAWLEINMSSNWWDPWPAVIYLLPMVVFTITMTPKLNYATKPTPGNNADDNNLSAKLLPSEK